MASRYHILLNISSHFSFMELGDTSVAWITKFYSYLMFTKPQQKQRQLQNWGRLGSKTRLLDKNIKPDF
jgi:hypothetical protein